MKEGRVSSARVWSAGRGEREREKSGDKPLLVDSEPPPPLSATPPPTPNTHTHPSADTTHSLFTVVHGSDGRQRETQTFKGKKKGITDHRSVLAVCLCVFWFCGGGEVRLWWWWGGGEGCGGGGR